MSKRRFEREVDTLCDEVLGNLSSEERLQALLQQLAAGEQTGATELDETTPCETHSMRDPEYVTDRVATMLIRQRAVYRLHRWLLEFRWRYTFDVYATNNRTTQVDAGDHPGDPGLALCHLAELHAEYADFAEEELGVSLETLLAGHDTGRNVLAQVEATLLEYRELLEDALCEYAAMHTATDGSDSSDGDNAHSE